MGLTFDLLDGIDAADAEWSRLAEAAGNVFSTPEWASVWWSHFGAGRDLRVLAGRDDDGSTAVVLPLYVNRTRPLRVLRFVGHGVADQLGPVCAPADRERVAAALRRAPGGPALARRPAGRRPRERSRGLERPDRGHRAARRAQPDARDRGAELGRVPRLEEQELPRPGAGAASASWPRATSSPSG